MNSLKSPCFGPEMWKLLSKKPLILHSRFCNDSNQRNPSKTMRPDFMKFKIFLGNYKSYILRID